MKKFILGLLAIGAIAPVAFAGTETYSGKEMKQVAPPPCPEWYADRELNISLWGTYAFTGNDARDDRYLDGDHAWGGGVDAKYFFHRYFGIGIEGWAVDARRGFIRDNDGDPITFPNSGNEHRAVGAVLGTLTLRYPFHCSRFSPYIFGGGGAIFGGGQRPINQWFREGPGGTAVTGPGGLISNGGEGFDIFKTVGRTESEAEGIGQVGGGLEIRFTPHIGWISDFSWNFVNGPKNNFGMARTGVNFAF